MNVFKNATRPLMSLSLLLVALAAGCKGGQDPILGGRGSATLAPTVLSVTPLNNATSVSLSSPGITATFSEPMATITGGATFTVVTAGAGPSPTGTVALDSTNRIATFTLTPGTTLAPLNAFTATVTGATSSATGLALANPYVWRFTTGPIPDTTRPRVTITVPATRNPATIDVPLNTSVIAAFTEDMAAASITAAGTFVLTGPSGTIAGALSYASRSASFTPTAALAFNTTYTATITTAATDLAGNQLAGNQAPLPAASNYVWTFTTGPAPDTTRPHVTLTNPRTTIPGPTLDIPTNSAIAAAFDEDMAPASITAAGTFTVTGNGGATVSGSVSYSGRTAVFTPVAVLANSTMYTATVSMAATDLAGNQLAGNQVPLAGPSNYAWTFTTGAAPDTVRPRVTLTNPRTTIPGPTLNATTNTAIAASFTKDMAPTTINTLSFTLTGAGGVAVPGGVSYASGTAVFTPVTVLAANTTYTATITKAATDLAGNQLAGNQVPLAGPSDYIWTFTTSVAPDTTRPRVMLTIPATTIPGPTLGVPTNSAVTAVFSEDMAATTVTTATFKVTGPGSTAVVGNVLYASGTAVFTPTSILALDTIYTATITKAATDLAGNQLAGNQVPLSGPSDYIWTFRTSAPVPAANISVLSTDPAAGSSLVCPTASFNATFNVPSGLRMDPTTVNATTFTVTGPSPTFTPVIATSVLVDVATGHIVTFTPASALIVGTTYTATIKSGTSGVKDLAIPANKMLADFVWTFTVVNCTAPPPSPLGSAAGFGIMATSAITNTGAATMINGDVALEPGTSCGLMPVQVNGTIHINDTASHQAYADLLTAYNYFKNLTPGVAISAGADLGALYPASAGGIPPGTYTSGSSMLVSTPLVFNAGGNANAVWVFQIGSSVTTNVGGGNISLLNGANPNNIYWVPTASATVGVGTTFYGTIVAGVSITGQTGAIINGRLLAGAIGAGTIALDTNTVNVPAH
jgi:hypothetical protein